MGLQGESSSGPVGLSDAPPAPSPSRRGLVRRAYAECWGRWMSPQSPPRSQAITAPVAPLELRLALPRCIQPGVQVGSRPSITTSSNWSMACDTSWTIGKLTVTLAAREVIQSDSVP